MRLKFEKVIPPFDLNIDKFFDLDERFAHLLPKF